MATVIVDDWAPAAGGGAAPTLPFDLEQAKQDLGVSKLSVLRPNWEQLIGNMVHVRLSVKFWRALDRITLEDMGLENAPEEYRRVAQRRIELGHFTLMPKADLDRLHCIEEK